MTQRGDKPASDEAMKRHGLWVPGGHGERQTDTDVGPLLTRRRILQLGGSGAALLAGGSLLAACGSGAPVSPGTTASSGAPVRGGTLNVGMLGAGSSESINPFVLPDLCSYARACALYDQLFNVSSDGKSLDPGLALSAEPNADATVWTFKLRDGVRWHDGKPLTADDVVYTINMWGSPNALLSGYFEPIIDYKGVRARDPLTVEVTLLRSLGQFPSMVPFANFVVVQNGATFKQLEAKGIGTGPFKLDSFQPGQQSVMSANKDYWQTGKPYVDKLVINSTFSDETPRLNALLAGEIDVMPIMPGELAKQQMSSQQVTVLNSPSNQANFFYFRVDQAPFNNPQVREAFKLVADRSLLVANALDGLGTIGNDLFGYGTEYFDTALKREQDLEKARSLLKAAGQSGLTVQLSTSSAVPSGIQAATLFAAQAAGAGIKIKLDTIDPSRYFTPSTGGWGSYTMGQDTTNPGPTLTYGWLAPLTALNAEAHWDTAGDKLFNDALSAIDPSAAAANWTDFQQQYFDTGGHLLWGFADLTDAVSKNVHGFVATPAFYLNNFRFADGWLAK